MKKIILLLFAIGLFIISGCYYDKEDLLYGSNTCDTTNVTYSQSVKSILTNNSCLSCHAGVGASGGINLDTYASVKAVADNGKLYGSITHASGYAAMPQGGTMPSCNIKKIKAWIDSGSVNN